MKCKIICFSLLLSFFYSCGPEKTIDNRDSSTSSPGQNQGLDISDFSDAQSDKKFYESFQMELDWVKPPKVGSSQANRFKLLLKDLDGNPMKVSFFDFRIYMKIHGHGGLDKNRLVEKESDDSLICSNFFFTMPGPWELKLRIAVGSEKFAFDLPIDVAN